MVLEPVLSPTCQSSDIVRHSLLGERKPRYKCCNSEYQRCTFMLNYIKFMNHLKLIFGCVVLEISFPNRVE